MAINKDHEAELQEMCAKFVRDPYGFVMWAFPWGEEGTVLEDEDGPDEWQTKLLKDLGHALTYGWVDNNGVQVDCTSGIQLACRSGHGIGKSALMAMLEIWFQSCHPQCMTITTANTDTQLKSKTWRELAKWHKLAINAHWFEWSATRFVFRGDPVNWGGNAIPWSEKNPEAFAGAHAKYLMIKFDEASAIPDIICQTAEGAMTDVGGVKIWIKFGNPTRPTGDFAECFKKKRKYWIRYEIDSRTSKRTDKKKIQEWIDIYGDDSDFVRVRVKGQEPRSGVKQFIPNDIVEEAAGKVIHPTAYINSPKIVGVDVALEGDDQTVIVVRQGMAAYSLTKFRESDALKLSGIIAQFIKDKEPDQVFVDNGNIGPVIVQNLHRWGHQHLVTAVNFGGKSDLEQCKNKRTAMWWHMRDWLASGGCIPDDQELRDDLIGPEYFPDDNGIVCLERKKDMKARGLASPDCGDSLALTFAFPVAAKSDQMKHRANRRAQEQKDYKYFDY
jgi:hypothetical protein